MNFEQAQANANIITGKASDVARHLAFAGIALVWVFAGGGTEKVEDVRLADFRWVLLVFALGLAIDFSQYCWQSFYMRRLVRKHETELKGPGKGYRQSDRDWSDRLFAAKLATVATGYVLLLVQIWLNI